MDFTIETYHSLIYTLQKQGFLFLTFSDFLLSRKQKTIIIRHDVDKLPVNSLEFAHIQYKLGIIGSYYFRTMPETWDEKIIREITGMGHEIGYHYEDLSFAHAKLKAEGNRRKAEGKELEKLLVDIGIESFRKNFEKLRKIAPVKTICMHGSPMSRWDSRLLWKYYDYHDFGIIGEPYFDIDFDEVLYLTDTGRRWDGENVTVRDKARSREQGAGSENPYKDWKVKPLAFRQKKSTLESPVPSPQSLVPFPRFHSTSDIIKAANENRLPDKIMLTFHPQRWTDKPLPWVKELVWQNMKNVGKYFVVKMRCEK